MARILRQAGLNIHVGRYSIRLEDFSHFVIQHYGGDICDPDIDVDADSDEDLLRDAKQVSSVLSSAHIAHRFEIYDEQNNMIAYYHHDWPKSDDRLILPRIKAPDQFFN